MKFIIIRYPDASGRHVIALVAGAMTWRPVHECPRMSTNVHECPRMSTNVHECPRMSTNVHECPRMSRRDMSTNRGAAPVRVARLRSLKFNYSLIGAIRFNEIQLDSIRFNEIQLAPETLSARGGLQVARARQNDLLLISLYIYIYIYIYASAPGRPRPRELLVRRALVIRIG